MKKSSDVRVICNGGAILCLFQLINLDISFLPFGKRILWLISNIVGGLSDKVYRCEKYLIINYLVTGKKWWNILRTPYFKKYFILCSWVVIVNFFDEPNLSKIRGFFTLIHNLDYICEEVLQNRLPKGISVHLYMWIDEDNHQLDRWWDPQHACI